ncbi:arsenate reductase (glutaredoxin) [Brevundimonas sp. AJA228-03]|uniref:arsenate reductase (glutaredoxin) n=1 Tax=Brevundimonas sp. AJA228-03 TaxID=2752515 RepID=UPI001AE0CCC7|nr:arsenate reductase (glutaredoxin) [Brevundimonas sp. AJA228-03]QTN19419.1 arsenate reductase (glutaredoxin) [Brevundimonas sp. AJA228-03]
MDVVIYHNPACGTSRNALALIRHVGIEPHVIESLKTPPSRAMIVDLAARAGVPIRMLMRAKEAAFSDLGLGDPGLDDDRLLDAIGAQPVLLNRPIVVSGLGVRLCRPSEAVLDLLPSDGLKPFTREDGAVVVDASGRRVLP